MYNLIMVNKFAIWLTDEMNRRGWSNSELARRSGISHTTISMIIGGQNKVGLKSARGIARAFGLPLEEVLKVANLNNHYSDKENDPIVRELSEVSRYLPETKKREVLDFARFLYQGYMLNMTEEEVKAQIEEILKGMPEDEREKYATSLLGLISRSQENIQKGQPKSLEEND